MRPVQPSVVAVQRHVMLSAVPSSGIVNNMIRITGIGDRDRPEWLIRISGIRIMVSRGSYDVGENRELASDEEPGASTAAMLDTKWREQCAGHLFPS